MIQNTVWLLDYNPAFNINGEIFAFSSSFSCFGVERNCIVGLSRDHQDIVHVVGMDDADMEHLKT